MEPYKLQLLHAADLEGGIEALEDAPNFSAVVDALSAEEPENTLILSSGDNYIPGPFFAASADPSLAAVLGEAGQGRGDILIANSIGFQAAALGNHEFDQGTDLLASLIAADGNYPGTNFPYLSANLDFSTDSNLADLVVEDGQEASTIPNSLAKSTVITVAGEQIGIVGATTPLLPDISSPGDVTVIPSDPNDLAALAAEIQPAVDALRQQGINKIILLSHLQQLELERQLAGNLDGVDIIVAGGSNTLLADETDRLREGDTAADTYPILSESASGEPLAIVNTDGNYSYVGRLVAEFDNDGLLIPDSIDVEVSGAYATDEQGVIDTGNFAPNPAVVEVTDALGEVIAAKDGNTFGQTEVFLNGARNDVRTQETNLGNLTADANLAIARSVDETTAISIKNGGGIRNSIGGVEPATGEGIPPTANELAGKEAGEVSQLDIENSLRFNNELSLVTLTAEQLVAVIEYGVAATASGATPGQFPQVAGIAFSFDPDLEPGNRVQSLVVQDAEGNITDVVVENGELVADPSQEFRTVTLNFLADGGDGYPFAEFAAANPELFDRVDLTALDLDAGAATFANPGTEQDALAEYLAAEFATEPFTGEDVEPAEDLRIQNLEVREDTVIDGIVPTEPTAPTPTRDITLTPLSTYETGEFDAGAAEIVAYDPDTQQLFVVNAEAAQIDVLDASDPTNLTKALEIDVTPYGAVANSIDIRNGVVAVAVENQATQSFGTVAFFDTAGEFLNAVPVGALPDMLTFTPDGEKVLVANEGEPNDDYTVDPEGAVSIIDLSGGVDNLSSNDVTFVDFREFNSQAEQLQADGVRIFGPDATVAQDVEPEYITVSDDSATAWVALQENNALAELDIAAGEVTNILPLGYKDHSVAGNGLDASDEDGEINITTYDNLVGMYQPDAIASYSVGDETFIITANEGDARDYDAFSEEARVADLELDPTAFPNAAELQADQVLGRLTVTTANGDTDGDGDYDQLYAFGGRSFGIWDTQGNLVYDSGDEFEQITAAQLPGEFNSDNTENDSFDSRSDAKGPEPEGVVTGVIGDRTYAFIGLERVGGVMIYDVTEPQSPTFVEYINNRNFEGDAEAGTAGDLGPEGLTFIPAATSPNQRPLLAVSNEVSGSTTLYEISNLLNGSGGQNTFDITPGNGNYVITDFGGVGTGTAPTAAAIAEVDTLKFTGEGLTAGNLLLTQADDELLISFDGVDNLAVRLRDFDLENLDNLTQATGATIDIGNILFNGQEQIRDSFDVINADAEIAQIYNRNSVTFLNELDNDVAGFSDSNDVINGQGGDDVLRGLGGNDTLRGGAGDDLLFGGTGDDLLQGGAGDDFLDGGEGDDIAFGGSGSDQLIANGNDQLFGDDSNDILDARAGDGGNELFGGAGDDTLYASSNDFLLGGFDNDLLDASEGEGNNFLFGGAGNDTLIAGVSDQLFGNDGDDALFAGSGGNSLTGGEGADQFWIADGSLPAEINTIADYEVGVDVIGISGVAGLTSFNNLTITQIDEDTVIQALGQDLALLTEVTATDLSSSNFVFA